MEGPPKRANKRTPEEDEGLPHGCSGEEDCACDACEDAERTARKLGINLEAFKDAYLGTGAMSEDDSASSDLDMVDEDHHLEGDRFRPRTPPMNRQEMMDLRVEIDEQMDQDAIALQRYNAMNRGNQIPRPWIPHDEWIKNHPGNRFHPG